MRRKLGGWVRNKMKRVGGWVGGWLSGLFVCTNESNRCVGGWVGGWMYRWVDGWVVYLVVLAGVVCPLDDVVRAVVAVGGQGVVDLLGEVGGWVGG